MPYDPVLDIDGHDLARAARGESSVLPPDEARWLLIRAPMPDEYRLPYWRAWVFISLASAITSGLVIVLILWRRRLRAWALNHYIVGLAIPDVFFSAACTVTCAMHVATGDMWDGRGAWMCDVQSYYTIFGVAGSMWVNVIITHKVHQLAQCTQRMKTFQPPSVSEIWRQLAIVYLAVAAFCVVPTFGYKIWPDLPARSFAIRGLNCLPTEYDAPSRLFFFGFTVTGVITLPSVILTALAARILALTVVRQYYGPFADSVASFMRSRRACHAPVATSEVGVRADSGGSDSALYMAGEHRMALSAQVSKQAVTAMMLFFFRLLIVMGIMWVPFFVIWLVQVPWYMLGGHLCWFAGSWAHLQGLVSAVLYMTKKDIRDELRAVLACRGNTVDAPLAPSVSAAASTAAAMNAAGRPDWSEMELGRLPTPPSPAFDVHRRSASPDSLASSDLASAATATTTGAGGSQAEQLMQGMDILSKEARDAIIARERLPMVVVPWHSWASAGRIPAFGDGLSRLLNPTDVVIFVSHRWWAPDAPDDALGNKYRLICRGVRRIARLNTVPLEGVVVWADYSCIDQQDHQRQQLGIESLITYAMRSTFVLIPVQPRSRNLDALWRASHPIDLPDYGERAWCRCEIYVFLCLGEMCRQRASVYGYGSKRLQAGAAHGGGAGCSAGGGDEVGPGDISDGDGSKAPFFMRVIGNGWMLGPNRGDAGPVPPMPHAKELQPAAGEYSENSGHRPSGLRGGFGSGSDVNGPRGGLGCGSNFGEGGFAEWPCADPGASGDERPQAPMLAHAPAAGSSEAEAPPQIEGDTRDDTVVGTAPQRPTGAKGWPADDEVLLRRAQAATARYPPITPAAARSRSTHASHSRISWLEAVMEWWDFNAPTGLGMRTEVFKELVSEDGGARFTEDELPSRGELTLEEDRTHISALELEIRSRFVKVCADRAMAVFKSAGGSRRAFKLDRKQVHSTEVPAIVRGLLDSREVASLTAVSLAGNFLHAQGVRCLMRQLICSQTTPALAELNLGSNAHLGSDGAAAIAESLTRPQCTLRRLFLDACGLDNPAGFCLVRGLRDSHCLELLDLRNNALTDTSVVSLHETTISVAQVSGISITLIVDGNPISQRVYQLFEGGIMQRAGF